MATVFLPPFALSFILTRYPDGHPRYVFDLGGKWFNERKWVEHKRALLREKRKGLMLTPEAFAMLNNKKKVAMTTAAYHLMTSSSPMPNAFHKR